MKYIITPSGANSETGSRYHAATGISYKIKYSRRKTIAISISPPGRILVRAPLLTSGRIIDDIVGKKSEWIKDILKKFSSMVFIDPVTGFSDGDLILFQGTEHRLKVCRSDSNYIHYEPGSLEAGLKAENDPMVVKAMLEMFFRDAATRLLGPMFTELVKKHRGYNFMPSAFTVKKMKSRWGSCSSGGRIAISYDLIRLDSRFAEYVMIHELCHLRHLNHGKEFYTLLSEIYPGWKAVRADLRRYVR